MQGALLFAALVLLSHASVGVALRDATFVCNADGGEDWPTVQRQILRLLDGGVKTDALRGELSRAASSDPAEQHQDCLPGRIALRFLLLLTGPVVNRDQ